MFLSGVELFRAVGMIMVLYTDLTVGQIFAVFSYLWFMMGPVQELLNMQYSFYAADAARRRINAMLALEAPLRPVASTPSSVALPCRWRCAT
ncbi:hypothetical protein MBH78_23235 [Oceanimonas sp. NS1]|nr:hypothetical protein [Oceanimonas sp. NS1]